MASLRVRLLLALLGVVLLAIGLTAFVASRGTTTEFGRYVDRSVERDRRVVAILLEEEIRRQDGLEAAEPLAARLSEVYHREVRVTDPNGVALLTTGRIANPPAPRSPVSAAANPAPFVYSLGPGQSILVASAETPRAAQPAAQPAAGAIQRSEQSFLGSVNRAFWAAALLALVVAGGTGAALARAILRPVDALTRAARRLASGDLSQRVEISGRDELGELSAAFNRMADSLEQGERLRRQMVTDVTHELRTPLTHMQGTLEAVQDGLLPLDQAMVARLHDEVRQLGAIVGDLQEIAQAEAGQLRLELVALEAPRLLARAAGEVRAELMARGVTLTLDLPPTLPPLRADEGRLGQILRNLLTNALTHTPTGGSIVLGARPLPEAVEIFVRDNGAGIPAAALPHIWDRFYRADPSRSRATGGRGLGLAIVRELVLAQGGDVQAESREGEGTTIRLTLPRP